MSKPPRPFICLVEDDEIMGESLCDRFSLEGLHVDWYQTGAEALRAINHNRYCMVISDVRLPGMSGEELFEKLLAENKEIPPFIFITGYGSVDRAVRLLKLGAVDYISKPFDLDQMVEKISKLCPPLKISRPEEKSSHTLGISPAMRNIEESIPRMARLANMILITGESGVGKEYVAQLIHKHSRDGGSGLPFVPVNCGAITESLLESELFGYEKGAFTGATRTRKGVIEQAHGGTLFLDEIGDMPLSMQVKLLRAIQERRIVRVGGETPVPVDVRLICATNRDLKKMVEDGTFREDLYYRIHVIRLRIPPLRDRKEDILWFAQLFLRQYSEQLGGESRIIPPEAEQALLTYSWPGNLRELKHSIERACIMSPKAALEPSFFFDDSFNLQQTGEIAGEGNLSAYLNNCERNFILQVLKDNQWHLGRTSSKLGISRKNLWEKMKKLGIQTDKSNENSP